MGAFESKSGTSVAIGNFLFLLSHKGFKLKDGQG